MIGYLTILWQNMLRSHNLVGQTIQRYIKLLTDDLKLSTPALPLISAVGFDEIRYVSIDHIEKWTVAAGRKKEITLPNRIEEVFRPMEAPVSIRNTVSDFTPARLWYDVNGNWVDSILRACMEATLGFIVQKPGICEVRKEQSFCASAFMLTDGFCRRNSFAGSRLL